MSNQHGAGGGATGMERPPLPPIKYDALNRELLYSVEALVADWLPGGKKQGHEYVCGGLSGGGGSSCSVCVVGERAGRWADFASDDRGNDLISLYAAIHMLDQATAARQLARDYGLEDVAGIVVRDDAPRPPPPPRPPAPPPPAKPESEGWTPVVPVPEFGRPGTFEHYHRKPEDLAHVFEYRVGDDLHGYVVRFRTSDGGKDTLPRTFCRSARDQSYKWQWKTWDEPRPLYLPGKLLPDAAGLAGLTVVVVEGERKADVLHALLAQACPGVYLVVSWPGGSKAWKRADWAWLQGAQAVLLWPDCDAQRAKPPMADVRACGTDAEALALLKARQPLLPEAKQPGWAAMVGIGWLLQAQGAQPRLLRIPAPGDKPSGWDAADAIEAEGWGRDEVLGLFATAFALPSEDLGADTGACTDGPAPAPAPKGAAPEKNDGPAAAGEGAGDGGEGGRPDWLEPFWNRKKRFWMVSRELVIAALKHDPKLKDVIGTDTFSRRLVARRDWPWAYGKAGEVTGTTDLMLARYLSEAYGLPSITRSAVYEALETVAFEQQFHPVQDYLKGLVWDKKARLDKWLVFVLGERPETLQAKVYEYLCQVGRYWLLGMVYRAMEPGCKFDYCPVVEGAGGLRKSTLIETLAGSDWFSATPFDVGHGKDGQEQVQGRWLYEIAELAQFGKADVELIKAFISEKVDRYRPSYGRVVEAFPRQCVLAGTTNQRKWLRDRTGNRRFWPVPVRHVINIEWLQKWRDQLLAEAFARYSAGERCYPAPEDEDRLFVPMQERRLVDSTLTDALVDVLTRDPMGNGLGQEVNNLTAFVPSHKLVAALGLDPGKTSSRLDAQLRGWLEQQGWVYKKKQVNGVRSHGWERPQNWPPEGDLQDTDEYVKPVADAPAGPDAGGLDEPF